MLSRKRYNYHLNFKAIYLCHYYVLYLIKSFTLKIFLSFTFIIISFAAAAQSDLLFLMDATSGRIGGYSEITYTITNISSNDVNNIHIDHPDAIVPNFNLSPATLSPGATITATGRIAISGGNLEILRARYTLATATGTVNGATITEISDGIDLLGNRVSDGASTYFFTEPTDYGIIYIDVDADGNYDLNVDSPVANAVINVADNQGNSFSFTTNEAGWWQLSDLNSQMIAGEVHRAVIDLNSFPAAGTNYQLTEGEMPFSFIITLADVFPQAHGYSDGTSNFGLMQTSVYLDDNNNGIKDNGEVSVPNTNFEFIADNDPATAVVINNGTGLPVIKSDLNPGVQLNDVNASMGQWSNYFTITTPNYDDIVTAAGTTSILDFAVIETSPNNRDVAVYMTNIIPPNPGFDHVVKVIIDNKLNGTAAGTLSFTHDARSSLLSITDSNGSDLLVNGTATATSSGFNLSYSLTDFNQSEIVVRMSTPTTGLQLGDIFIHDVTISPTSQDNTATNNSATLNVALVASYDPNDITEIRGPSVPINTFSNTDYLEYTIRFQNFGTASAQFVRVLSRLHRLLDVSTFEIITTSHDYSFEQKDRGGLDFFFDNIQLPPESVDEAGSHGFIRYRIKPLPGFTVGDVITARADIYFDYNAPVITETWMTTFDMPASIEDFNFVSAYPIPLTGNKLFVKNIDSGLARLYSLGGREIWKGDLENGQIELDHLQTGLYILKIASGSQITTLKLIKE